MRPVRLSNEKLEARTVLAGFTFQVVDDLNLISAETEQLISNSAHYALNRISKHMAWQGTLDSEVRVRPASENPFPNTNGLLPSVTSLSWMNDHWSNDTLVELLTGIDRQPLNADAGMTIYLGDDGQIRNYGLPVWFDPNPIDYVPANVPSGKFDYIGVFFHEVFHGMGFHAASQEFRDHTTTIDGNDYFIGSETQQLLGGKLPLAPRLGGSLQDHYGNTSLPGNTLTSGLMFQWGNYEGNRLDIGKLDLAILEDLGMTIKSSEGLPLVDTIDSGVPRNTLSKLSISENIPIGTIVGTLSTTTGPVGVTFALADGGLDNSAFEIVGNVLKTKVSIDFETQASYSILVRNTNAQGVWTATPFTIEVEPASDERPTAIADTGRARRDEAIVIDVLANDTFVLSPLVPATLQIEQQSTNGQATVIDGKIRFSPSARFLGQTQFRYSIQNTLGVRSLPAEVTITVDGSLYQNPNNSLDVTGDTRVTPLDALVIINELNRRAATPVEDLGNSAPPYFDVNADYWVTSLDALIVINYLNLAPANAGGEGESGSEASCERESFFESFGADETSATIMGTKRWARHVRTVSFNP